jgi:hypothetical protein
VNGRLPADELVAVGAGMLHALVHALYVHLQLVVQRESFAAHAAHVRLQPLSWVLSKVKCEHNILIASYNFIFLLLLGYYAHVLKYLAMVTGCRPPPPSFTCS